MTIKELRGRALAKYKSHKLNSWILGLVCGLFSASIVALNIVLPSLTIITVPLLVLPCIFACAVLHEAINEGIEVNLSNFLKYFALFFRSPFNHSFNVIRNFFKSLLRFLGVFIISSVVVYMIYANIYGDTFVNLYNAFAEAVYDETDSDIINSLLMENDNLLMQYIISSIEPALFVSVFAFIFLCSKDSVKIYLSVCLPKSNSSFIHKTAKRAMHQHSKEYYKYHLGLNWPLIILMLVGFVGGRIMTGFVFDNPLMGVSVGVSFGFALSSFFFPFYFANNSTIFEEFEPYFKNSSKEIVEDLIHRIESVTEVDEEDKERFEKMMEELGDPLSDEEDNDKDNNDNNPSE